jgi:putative tryptophan/tyrosine transport system substrate-binding protein
MHYVKRREFITLIGAAAAWPLAARAQQFGKMSRVGVLVSLSAPHPFTEAFRSGMRDLGYIEDRNIAIEWRYADAQFSRAVELAAELVRLQVDVIAAYHTPAVKAAMNATRTIPIVMSPAGAPLEMGLVESLAHPGGNVTGLSNMEAELGGKRLDLLREAIPGLARVAVLAAKTDPFTASFVQDLQNGAARLGLQLHPVMVNSPSEFEEAFATMSAAGDQAVIVQPNFLPQTAAIVALAAKHRLAILSSYRDTKQANHLHRCSATSILPVPLSYSGLVRAHRHDGSHVRRPHVAAPGRRTVNTEPLPGSLVTVTSPPIMRASLRERARPSPVPP